MLRLFIMLLLFVTTSATMYAQGLPELLSNRLDHVIAYLRPTCMLDCMLNNSEICLKNDKTIHLKNNYSEIIRAKITYIMKQAVNTEQTTDFNALTTRSLHGNCPEPIMDKLADFKKHPKIRSKIHQKDHNESTNANRCLNNTSTASSSDLSPIKIKMPPSRLVTTLNKGHLIRNHLKENWREEVQQYYSSTPFPSSLQNSKSTDDNPSLPSFNTPAADFQPEFKTDTISAKTKDNKRLYFGYTSTNGYRFYSTISFTDPESGIQMNLPVPYSGSDPFIIALQSSLSRLMNGAKGKETISILMQLTNNIEIVDSEVPNFTTPNGKFIHWDYRRLTAGVDEDGSLIRPPFIGLAHEALHCLRLFSGRFDNTSWIIFTAALSHEITGDIINEEKYITYGENIIRAEHGLRLLKYYATYDNKKPVRKTRIIDKKRNSRFFGKNAFDSIFILKTQYESLRTK